MKSFLEPILKATDAVTITEDSFNFLNFSGRKAYYAQGFKGQGIIGAVIDTGCNYNHEEFKTADNRLRLAGEKSFCSYTEEAKDDHGHGTHTAGTIFGKRCGILPEAKMLIVKALDGSGSNSIDGIISSFEYVSKWRDSAGNPVDFVSASLSVPYSYMNPGDIDRFHNAIKALVALDIPVIVSAGNTGEDSTTRYPACFEEPITVGAVDIDKNIAYFSTKSNVVDLCQIGVGVISADYKTTNGYCSKDGTSMSTPLSAGIIGLIQCRYKVMAKKRMTEAHLYDTAKFLNTLDLGTAGIDKEYGAGFFTLDTRPIIKIKGTTNSRIYTVNGIAKQFDVDPIEVPPGRTLLPMRPLMEEYGHTVSWDGGNGWQIQ